MSSKILEQFKDNLAYKRTRGRPARNITLPTEYQNYLTNFARTLPTRMSKANTDEYISIAKRFLAFAGDKPLDRQTIDEYVDSFNKDNTRSFAFGVVKRIFDANNGLKNEWPYLKGESPQIRQGDTYSPALKSEVIKTLIRDRNKLTDSETCFLALATIYGLRRIEMSTITSEDVRLGDNAIFIRTVKGGRQRWHKIPKEIKPYLTKHNFDKEISVDELSVMFWEILEKNNLKAALKAALKKKFNIERLGWHSIRHMVVTLLIDSGLNAFLVKDFLRWKGPPAQGLAMPAYYHATTLVGPEGTDPIITGTEGDIKIFKKHPFLKYWK